MSDRLAELDRKHIDEALERHATLIVAARLAGHTGRQLEVTPRQRDVLRVMSHGHTRASAAAELGISTDTVLTHLKIARRRLNARNTTQAVAEALRRGLIT